MKRILLLIAALLPAVALAGFPLEATLDEMAREADHILIGRVTGVDMIDGNGVQVTDEDARTGPGLNNKIRLLISVDEVLVTNAASVPKILPVPLASHLHYSLGQIEEAHAGDTEVRGPTLVGSSPAFSSGHSKTRMRRYGCTKRRTVRSHAGLERTHSPPPPDALKGANSGGSLSLM